jgi:hypothetical protein
VVSTTDPYDRILGFLDRIRYFFFQVAPQLYLDAEWIPFQSHYFSGNLVEPEIEPGTSRSVANELGPLNQRGGLMVVRIYLNLHLRN